MMIGIVSQQAVIVPEVGSYWAGQGGYYAGKITYADARQFHLIVADKAAEADSEWGPTATVTGATDADDGAADQSVIVAIGDLSSYPAFKRCVDHTADGHADFYLPSLNETALLYTNLSPTNVDQVALFATGGAQAFAGGAYYRSSTEFSADAAWMRRLDNGAVSTAYYKNSAIRKVRPIRRVAT